MYDVETAEIVVDDGSGRPLRTVVGERGPLETLAPAPTASLQRRLALIPAGADGVVIQRGDPRERPAASSHVGVVDGIVVRFRGRPRVSGILAVAGRANGSRFDRQDLRLLEALAANVGSAMGSSQLIDELAASLADVTHLAALVSSSDDAIIALTPNGAVTSWNAAAERLLGYGAKEALGRVATDLVTAERAHDLTAVLERARAGAQVRDLVFDGRKRDGTAVPSRPPSRRSATPRGT